LDCLFEISSFLMWALMAINSPLKTAFAVSTGSRKLCSHFSFEPRNFLIPFLISSMTHWSFKGVVQSPWVCMVSVVFLATGF
jgi:hypothetical protein